MESSGLPIPIGGSQPLSAVLLELSPEGLKLTSVPIPTTTRYGSSTSTMYARGGFLQDPSSHLQENTGLSPLASWKHSLFHPPGIDPQAGATSVSPMTTWAQMNLVRQNEKKRIHYKQDVLKHESNPMYKPGSGAERVDKFVLELRNRPLDNKIGFWKKLVADFFAPQAKKRWCASLYKKEKHIETIFSKAVWQCDLCNDKAGCGFEIRGECLARLYKIKYDTGLLKEHLRVYAPTEHQDQSGQIYVHYSYAVEETEYEQARIVRYGQLRVVFSPDLKIRSWDFCSRNHKELIRRNSITSQVHQLGAAAQTCQLSTRDVSSAPSGELRQNSDMFVSSAYQMVDALKMPFISQIGFVNRFVRCLQISEVLNIMNGLILYSREHGTRPTECMAKFLQDSSNISLSGRNSDQQPEQQQSTPLTSLPPWFSSLANAGAGTGFCHNGFRSAGVYTSRGSNNPKRQRSDSNSRAPVEMKSLGFSTMAASQLNFPALAVSTPLLSSHPQVSHPFYGKLREESTVRGVHLEPQMSPLLQRDHHSNLPNPINFPSTANEIIQRVIAAQSYNDAEKLNGIIPTARRANGDKCSGGSSAPSDGVVYIDIEKYEEKNREMNLSAPNNARTLGNFMGVDVSPHNAEGEYISPEFDDRLLEGFVDFDDLYDLLK